MCRNIKNLRVLDPPVSEEDFTNAALQFVRKISGYRKPSRVNQAAFDKAVKDIAGIAEELFESLAFKQISVADPIDAPFQ